jgi:transglutaminase-like putative cysteine protease
VITSAPGDADLAATYFVDYESPEVTEFVERTVRPGADRTEQAVTLYYALRDGVRYEIYGADLSRDGLRASQVLRARTGMCLHKSVLYAACLRLIGIPSRLVLADVRNHLASGRLNSLMGGDVFRHHCLTSAYFDGRWIWTTPVFGRTLCRLYRIAQLEFDGRHDSVHHPFDLDGRRHMEFLRVHGEFDDLPYDRIITDLRAAHPRLFAHGTRLTQGSLAGDRDRARAAGVARKEGMPP